MAQKAQLLTRPVYTLEFWGKCVSKKNSYLPINGKIIKDAKLRKALGALGEQIPPEMRDLKLVSPDVEVFFEVPDGRSDRDNAWVTLSDLLKDYGVIKNDSIKSFNGTITLHPAKIVGHWKTTVVLTPGATV